MNKGFTLFSSLVVAACLAMPLTADEAKDPNSVIARVNGEDITLGHMMIAYATLPDQFRDYPPEALFDGILDQLIQQTALSQSASGDVPDHVRLSLENERRSLMAAEVVEDLLAEEISEQDIQAAYDAQFVDSDQGEEYSAAHILVETEEEANAIKEELDGGADFAKLAQEKSTGPSGPRGGDLGWFGPGMMVPEFEAAAVALEPGQVSEPVQTQFGWHVIQLNDVRAKQAPAMELVRDELLARLQRDAVQAHVESLTESANIERLEIEGLEPSVIGELDLVRK